MQRNILFLYSELAGYLFACLNHWSELGHKATVIHWPVNPEAPFDLPEITNIQFIERSKIQTTKHLVSFIKKSEYDLILCSGWIDKGYIKALSKGNFDCPRVLLMDTRWSGSIKQKLARPMLTSLLRRSFEFAWVAGKGQADYAQKLGFGAKAIRTGFYVADTARFSAVEQKRRDRTDPIEHALIYLGRYVAHKGINDLWQAFIGAKKNHPRSDWKLICVGTGEEFDNRIEHPDIEHLGFVQPDKLVEILQRASVFVLPSHYEPWGVVVHELASSGFPMILSDEVGSAELFLEEGLNGFGFKAGDKEELQTKLETVFQLSNERIREMGDHSYRLSQKLSAQTWTETLLELL